MRQKMRGQDPDQIVRGSALSKFLCVLCLGLVAGSSVAYSEPLPEAACIELEAAKQKHIQSGIEQTFKKGAEWAKANLSEASLAVIKDYLAVEDKLLFRCPKGRTKARQALIKSASRPVPKKANTKTVRRSIPLPVRPNRVKR